MASTPSLHGTGGMHARPHAAPGAPAKAVAVASAAAAALAMALTLACRPAQAADAAGPSAAKAAAAAPPSSFVQVHADEPRAFGHFPGDVVQRRVTLSVPAGWALDEASLPEAGRRGRSFELRAVAWQPGGGWGGWSAATGVLTLTYQVFVAPTEARLLELPPLKLRFTGGPRPEDVRIDAWPLVVTPLAPVEASPRHGLGELRPAAPPPLVDATGPAQRLRWWAALAVPLLLYLAWVYGALPWWTRRQRPFGRALAVLAALPARPATPAAQATAREAAFRAVHQALNDSAGQVVFGHSLDAWLAAQPRYAPLRERLQAFFARSQGQFFGTNGADDADALAWLQRLCRDARDLERGSA